VNRLYSVVAQQFVLAERFPSQCLVSITLRYPSQKPIYRQGLLPILEISNQLVLVAIPAKTYVVTVVLLNSNLSITGLTLRTILGPGFQSTPNSVRAACWSSTNLRFDLAKCDIVVCVN